VAADGYRYYCSNVIAVAIIVLLVSRDSPVGIATGYGLDGPGSIPDKGRICSHFHIVQTGPTQLLLWIPEALSQGVKRSERETVHLSPSGAEVKNIWIYTSTPQYVFMTYCLIS
jgi:hypothetical protein